MERATTEPEYSIRIEPSAGPAAAAERMLDELADWASDCISRYADAPPTDVHDQLTYTTGWEPLLRQRRDGDILDFLREQRDAVCEHFATTGQWDHGYWRMHEVHHGTEHFELFLGMMARLDPTDACTRAQIVDAAEHTGNWSNDVEPWFDWEQGMYRSMYLGTDGVRVEPGLELNLPDHFRCINMAVIAHGLTGQQHYLDLAAAAAGQWAAAIAEGPRLPFALAPAASGGGGRALYALDESVMRAYRDFVGEMQSQQHDLGRAENLLASDGVGALLALWQRQGDPTARRAAERILDTLAPALADADAGAVADAMGRYRRVTGSKRYDATLLGAAEPLDPRRISQLNLVPPSPEPPEPPQTSEAPESAEATELPEFSASPSASTAAAPPAAATTPGVGKRSDAPTWYEDGQPRRHAPILLAVAAEIRDDPDLATHALDLGTAYLRLARRAFPDGRDHGCAATSISAIARGHGRENHAGVTTAVLARLLTTDATAIKHAMGR